MRGHAFDVSLILPVHDGERLLRRTLVEAAAWLEGRPERWELIVVDDGSRDATAQILRRFSAPVRLRVVTLPVNRGKGFAVRAGLAIASAPYAIFTDVDLAYPLSNVDRILERLKDGADAAIATRVHPQSAYLIRPSFFSYLYTRHLMGRIFNGIARAVAVPGITDTQAGLKGFRTRAVRPLLPRLRMDGFSFDVELLRALLDRGARIDEAPVTFRYDSEPTTVQFAVDAARMARDLVRIRWRSLRGRYRDASAGRLVIVADDYGLSPGINRAIEKTLLSGALDGASILVGADHARAALAWAAAHPERDLGVHLNATLGRPVSPASGVRSLVDSSGRFHPLGLFLLRAATGRIRLEELATEWRAQIAVARGAGVRIRHLDSHHHVHLVPWIFRRVAAPLAAEERVRLRVMDGPTLGGGLVPIAKALALLLLSRVDVRGRSLGSVEAHGTGMGWTASPTLATLRAIVARSRSGETVELVVHPGYPDAALTVSGDPYISGRDRERRILESAEFLAWRSRYRFSGTYPTLSMPSRATGSHWPSTRV